VVGDVEGEVLPHHAEADQADLCWFTHGPVLPPPPSCPIGGVTMPEPLHQRQHLPPARAR
jgi:hypothetical protein